MANNDLQEYCGTAFTFTISPERQSYGRRLGLEYNSTCFNKAEDAPQEYLSIAFNIIVDDEFKGIVYFDERKTINDICYGLMDFDLIEHNLGDEYDDSETAFITYIKQLFELNANFMKEANNMIASGKRLIGKYKKTEEFKELFCSKAMFCDPVYMPKPIIAERLLDMIFERGDKGEIALNRAILKDIPLEECVNQLEKIVFLEHIAGDSVYWIADHYTSDKINPFELSVREAKNEIDMVGISHNEIFYFNSVSAEPIGSSMGLSEGDFWTEKEANDYLETLEHQVSAFKEGDLVYFSRPDSKRIQEAEVIGLNFSNGKITYETDTECAFTFEDVGNNVFRTKEEAVKCKEMRSKCNEERTESNDHDKS